jgi:hypothetical protein
MTAEECRRRYAEKSLCIRGSEARRGKGRVTKERRVPDATPCQRDGRSLEQEDIALTPWLRRFVCTRFERTSVNVVACEASPLTAEPPTDLGLLPSYTAPTYPFLTTPSTISTLLPQNLSPNATSCRPTGCWPLCSDIYNQTRTDKTLAGIALSEQFDLAVPS